MQNAIKYFLNPTVDKMPEIAKVLQITLEQLYGIESQEQEGKPRVAPNARSKHMQETFEKLTATDQRALLKHAKGLAKD